MSHGREFLVGLVIVVSATVAIVGTIWLQGRTFGPVTNIDVLTESAGQLSEGNAVQYRGVRVGQVAEIEVLPDGSGVRIALILQGSVPLPVEPAVLFGPESLFGDWQAEIVSRTTYEAYPFFPVPAVREAEPRVLGGYALPELSRLSRSAEQIATNIQSLSERLELAFNEETASSLADAIGNIEAMTIELRTLVAQQGEVASSITASADSALAEIQVAAGAARRSFETVEETLAGAQLDSTMADVRLVAAGLRTVVEELSDSTSGLGVTLERADSTFARLDRITARIDSGEGGLGRLVSDTTFVVRAEDVLLQMELLLQDLRENPRRYVRLSIF